jgi:hypothetical protein
MPEPPDALRPPDTAAPPHTAGSPDTARSSDAAHETRPASPKRFTPAAPSGSKRLWQAMTKRPRLSHLGVGSLVALLGFAAAVQVRADDDDALANARRDDLVQILDGLRRQADRLDDHVTELEADRRDLISGADTEQEALEQAQERARVTGVLAGTAARASS